MKKLSLSLLALLLLPSPAFAGAVTGWGATDGFGAVPLSKGTSVLDLRLNASFPSKSVALPIVNFATGAFEGIEIGIGSGFNCSSLGEKTNRNSVEVVYPWLRAALPIQGMKTGVILGASIPGFNSSSEFMPGASALLDLPTGALTTSLNAGYARGTRSNSNWADGNLAFTLPWNGLTLYEEQFVNYPLEKANVPNGGLRVSLIVPLGDRLTLDLNPAFLWARNGTTTDWVFSPNLGIDYTF